MPGSSASAACARRISPAPGRNTSTSPSGSSRSTRRTAPATCVASGRSSGAGRCSIATSNIRPSLRTTSPPRKSRDRLGVERRGHRHHRQVGPFASRAAGAARRARDRWRRGARAARRARPRRRRAGCGVGEHAAHEQPLGDEAEPRLRARPPRRSGPSSRRSRPRARPARRRRAWRPAAPAAGAARAPRSRRVARPARRAARAERASSCPRPGGASTTAAPRDATASAIAGRQSSIGSGEGAAASSRSGPRSVDGTGEGSRSARPGADVGHTPTSSSPPIQARRFVVMPRRDRIRGPMIRCPTCGRRIRDAAPVCPDARPAAARAAAQRGEADAVRRPDAATCRRSACSQDAGAGRLRRGVPRRARAGRRARRHQGRARRQRVGRRGAAARGRRAVHGRPAPRARRVRARHAGRRVGVRGDGVRAARPCSPIGWPRCRGRWTSRSSRGHALAILARRRGRARARPGPLRSEAGERVHRSGVRRQAVRLRAGAQGGRARDAHRGDEGRGAGGHARVHVPRAVRGAHRHRRAQRHLCAGRDVLRDAGGRAAVLGQLRRRCSRATAAGGRRRCRGEWPIAVALEDAIMRCLAKDPGRRFAERHRAAARAAGGAGRGAGAPGRRRRRQPAAAAPARRRGSGREPAAKPAAAAARERRAVALLFFESKSNVGGDPRGGATPSARSWRTRAGTQYVLAFGHEVGDNPTRAAATAGEMVIARGLATRGAGRSRVGVGAGAPRRQPALPEPAVHQEGALSGRRRSGGRVAVAGRRRGAARRAQSEPVASRPGVSCVLAARPRRAEKTTTRMGVAPLVGRDELLRTLLDLARAARPASARPTITTLLGEPGYGKSHLAQMLVQHLEVSARDADDVRARQGGAGRRGRADDARAAAAHAGAARRGARRISAARCWRTSWARRPRRRSGPASRWRWGGRRPSTRSCARWRRRRARCVRRRRARSARALR